MVDVHLTTTFISSLTHCSVSSIYAFVDKGWGQVYVLYVCMCIVSTPVACKIAS